MQMSRTVLYALQALVFMAQAPPGAAIACGEIAQHGAMPKRYLLQVLRALVKCGILDSVAGVSGGYILKRPPRSITLEDIVAEFDDCLEPRIPREVRLTKPLRKQLLTRTQHVSTVLRRELHRITIADLAKVHAPR